MSVTDLQAKLSKIGLEEFIKEYGVEARYHETLPLVLLKYSQINSPTYDPLIRECRSIVLEKDTWKVVAKPLRRFYNYGEHAPDMETFNFDNCMYQEKLDGSCMQLFNYEGNWIVTTSGSFATQNIGPGMPSWSSLFHECFCIKYLSHLHTNWNFIFELTSPYNKVVHPHTKTSLTLLTIMDNTTCQELPYESVQAFLANYNAHNVMKLNSPIIYDFRSHEEAVNHYKKQHATFEGYVLVDNVYNRIKLKNPAYVALHHLKDNGNVFLAKRLVPLILDKSHELPEIYSYLPEIKEKAESIKNQIHDIFVQADLLLAHHNNLPQKEFAMAIKDQTYLMQGILFTARKNKLIPSEHIKLFEDRLIKFFS